MFKRFFLIVNVIVRSEMFLEKINLSSIFYPHINSHVDISVSLPTRMTWNFSLEYAVYKYIGKIISIWSHACKTSPVGPKMAYDYT